MSSIKNVALVGKGFLGQAVLKQLLAANFNVTVLSRSVNSTSPESKVVQVDFSSVESLTAALQGHDAVISTVAIEAVAGQKTVIDAAIRAGVKRFVPSDFASITTDPKAAREVSLFQPWIQVQDYLKEKAQAQEIEYTIFATGVFLNYAVGTPAFIDYQNRTIELHGNGDTPLSSTSVDGIGKAIAGALLKAEDTKNRVVRVHELLLTQNKLLELAKKTSGGATGWTETVKDPLEAVEIAGSKLSKEPTNILAFTALLKAIILSGKYEAGYTTVDNKLVGLDLLSDEQFEKTYAPLLVNSSLSE